MQFYMLYCLVYQRRERVFTINLEKRTGIENLFPRNYPPALCRDLLFIKADRRLPMQKQQQER